VSVIEPMTSTTAQAVSEACNSGSYAKALTLLKTSKVTLFGRTVEGGVEAHVASERGPGTYIVSVPAGTKARASCSCHDYKTRGGLCKHGAAALLACQREIGGAQSLPEVPAREKPKTPKKQLSETAPSGGVTPPWLSAKRKLNGDDESPATKRPRSASPEFVEDPVSLPKPKFPGQKKVKAAAAPPGPDLSGRKTAMRTAMLKNLLQKWAGFGRAEEFKAELRRWGEAPLEDAFGLLRRAASSEDAAGGAAIISELVQRPDGLAATASADAQGRTALHIAAAGRNLDVCRVLLSARACPNVKDSGGRTPLGLACKHRVEASQLWVEDPLVKMMKEAAGGAAVDPNGSTN